MLSNISSRLPICEFFLEQDLIDCGLHLKLCSICRPQNPLLRKYRIERQPDDPVIVIKHRADSAIVVLPAPRHLVSGAKLGLSGDSLKRNIIFFVQRRTGHGIIGIIEQLFHGAAQRHGQPKQCFPIGRRKALVALLVVL